MKISLNVLDELSETEVNIKCGGITDEVLKLQKILLDFAKKNSSISSFANDVEYFIPLSNILFFQTEDKGIILHTKKEVYNIKHKLYELENILPDNFSRISKSSIVNISQIHGINKTLSTGTSILFRDTQKQLFVSRSYYKSFKQNLDRNGGII